MNAAHETLSRDEETRGSSNRAFGFVFAVVFLVIAVWPLASGGALGYWPLAVAVAFGAIALAAPRLLAWPNRLWLRLGLLLHRVMSPIALALIFYVAIMPVGLVMRMLGKDLLRLRRRPDATTYWIERTPPGPPPDSLKNQF